MSAGETVVGNATPVARVLVSGEWGVVEHEGN